MRHPITPPPIGPDLRALGDGLEAAQSALRSRAKAWLGAPSAREGSHEGEMLGASQGVSKRPERSATTAVGGPTCTCCSGWRGRSALIGDAGLQPSDQALTALPTWPPLFGGRRKTAKESRAGPSGQRTLNGTRQKIVSDCATLQKRPKLGYEVTSQT